MGVTPAQSLAADNSPLAAGGVTVPVTGTLTGLVPRSNYYFYVTAENSVGSATGSTLFFTTGAAALLPATILVLSQENLAQFVARFPRLMSNIYVGMDIALRKLMSHLQSQVSLSVNGRLAGLLLYLNEIVKKQGWTPDEIDLPLSQADLAGWIGASRGHLNHALADLQKAGLIRLEAQKIILLDSPGLRQMSIERTPEPM